MTSLQTNLNQSETNLKYREILLPVARMIGGSVYNPKPDLDELGNPILDNKTGKPISNFNIGIAIPKTEPDWKLSAWGAIIKSIAEMAYPGQILSPTFSWKITDGDSIIPNKANRRPCDQNGYAGNWIMWLSQRWAPSLCDIKGVPLKTENVIMPGDWVQVYCSVAPNQPRPGKSHTPGVYINPMAVAFVGYHSDGRIVQAAIDVKAVAWGGTGIPAGVLSTPVGNDDVPNYVAPTAAPAPAPIPTPAPAPIPAPNFLHPAHQMTAAASGFSYEQMIQAGWTDELLVKSGMMLA